MEFAKYLIVIYFVIFKFRQISGHGMLVDPVNRKTAWRLGFPTPEEYTDNEGFCGGRETQHTYNDGKCGICGDDYRSPVPRSAENTGTYGIGVIVKTYKSGEIIDTQTNMSATHKGYFKFSLCPLRDSKQLEKEDCFIPLKLADDSEFFHIGEKEPGVFKAKVKLPNKVTCKHCVLRWEYITGNTWGDCEGKKEENDCAPQETFKSCSDITIE